MNRRGVKRMIVSMLLLALPMTFVAAQAAEVELPANIDTVEAFIAFRDGIATSPEGGAAVFVLAMNLYERDETLGHDTMVIALDAGELRSDANGYRGYSLGRRANEFVRRYLMPRPYLARSYLLGTSPSDRYEAPETWTVGLTRNAYSQVNESRVKVFVACSGADSPRPITLERNNRGIWKAYEYSSLFVGIRPPEEEVDDPL